MFHVGESLVFHKGRLSLSQNLEKESRDVRLFPEVFDRGEERLEIKDNGTRSRQPPEGLPIDAQVDVLDGEIRDGSSEGRVVLLEVQRLSDLDPPRPSLNGRT